MSTPETNGVNPLPTTPETDLIAFDGAADAGNPEGSKKKGKKKQRKKEEKRRRELLERFPATPPRIDSPPPEPESQLTAREARSSRRLRAWLRPAERNLNNSEVVAGHKASAMIAINCVMLSLSALAVSRDGDFSRVGWAVIPLVLTNLFSLAFAIRSAQQNPDSTLDRICAKPEDEFDEEIDTIIQDKEHFYGTLRRDAHRLALDLARRQRYLRSAYSVLLGGIPIAAAMFAVCIALTSKA